MSTTRCARDRAIAADQSTMAEERVVLAGVSDRAAVAGQTHKHIVNLRLKASRNRPVSASRQCVCQQGDGSSTGVLLESSPRIHGAPRCETEPRQCHPGVAASGRSYSPSREGWLK